MRFYIGTLSLVFALVFALTACAPHSKHDAVLGDAGEKVKQQEQYNAWFRSLTPEQRAREIQRQHERALSP
jgi:membrane-bound lytic murein transglycosylase B